MTTLQEIRIVIYRDSEGRSPFLEWLNSIKSREFLDRIDARLNLIRLGNLGDHKSLKGGIYELRLFFGSGYRIYFGTEGRTIIVLLNHRLHGINDNLSQIVFHSIRRFAGHGCGSDGSEQVYIIEADIE